ncbi:hypothetical protein HJFPF1_08109 [Paramyrothecium foliicola]|nr:hypothetical protein HJFPF1_08109 [Paramyrothecium foliicola]
MAFAPSYREHAHAPALPRIIAPPADHFRGPPDMSMSRSLAMSIPGSETRLDVPPALPPPQFPLGNPTHHHNHHHPHHQHNEMPKSRRAFGSVASPCSTYGSNYGSLMSSYDDRPNYKRRDHEYPVDDGYSSMSTDRSRDSLTAEFKGIHHNKFNFQSPADMHGDSLKKKLDPIRTAERSPPRSLLSSSANELLPRGNPDSRLLPTLSMPVQLPIHSRSVLESPGRFTDTPIYSAVSPTSGPFQGLPADQRSANDSSDMDRSPHHRRRNNSDDATSTQGSYDYADDMEIDDSTSLKRLHNDDAYSAGGQKRRAPSPSEDHMMHGVTGPSDFVRRRDIGSRGSPIPRLTTIPQGSSISSISSVSRSNSYMSTASMAPSTTTTATTNSFGRRSPVAGFSPGGISPTSCSSPYATSISLNPSPRTSISGRSAVHTRTVSGASPRKMNDIQKPGSKLQGFFMCDCCPKKPKKFETAEELSAHEAEKQYECSFCGNRFKNKNEAERHQNSLHVRRHSWSCSALAGYDRAFHDSTNRPGEADTCGYCGDEFPRSGRGPGNGALSGGIAPRHVTDEDWEERIRHLQEVHKFGECNSGKKFYRADHFRQHLKHSHAGTSGKWTNMLENACMLEEDPTPR